MILHLGKRHLGLMVAFAAGFVANSAFAAPMPLLLSQWAQNNPGKLPYHHCFISKIPNFMQGDVENQGLNGGSFSIGLGFSWLKGPSTDGGWGAHAQYINCVSHKMNVAFSIPISRLMMKNFVDAGISLDNGYVKLKNLDGMKLADLFGSYHAASINLVALGGGYARAYNSQNNGIQIIVQSLSAGASVGLPYSYLRLKPTYNHWYQEELGNPYVLTSASHVVPENILNTSFLTQTADGVFLQSKHAPYKIQEAGSSAHAPIIPVQGLKLPDDSTVLRFWNHGIIAESQAGKISYQTVGKTLVFRNIEDNNEINWSMLAAYEFVDDSNIDVYLPESQPVGSTVPAVIVE